MMHRSIFVLLALSTTPASGLRRHSKKAAIAASEGDPEATFLDLHKDDKEMMVSSSSPPSGNILNDQGNIDWTLNQLGTVNPNTAAVNMISGIAGMDFRAPLGPQMASLAVGLGSTIVNMVNPLLGAVFSIFAGLFGWNGADSSGNFVQEIMERVDKLITQRLNEFAQQMVQTSISAVMSQIDTCGDNESRWGQIPVLFAGHFPHVFLNCWNTEGAACDSWRKEGAAGQGLVLELQFTELMIMSAATVAKHGHAFRSFANNIKRAAQLTRNHYITFRAFRTNATNGATGGLTKGSLSCGGRPGKSARCTNTPSRDNLKKTDFCALSPRNCPYSCTADFKVTMQQRLDSCFNDYKKAISNDINALDAHHQANSKAAVALVSAAQ